MSSLSGVDAPVLSFDASQSTLAIATGDGRIRLFNVTQQRLIADITQELSIASGGKVATEVYSCIAWGIKVRENEEALFFFFLPLRVRLFFI